MDGAVPCSSFTVKTMRCKGPGQEQTQEAAEEVSAESSQETVVARTRWAVEADKTVGGRIRLEVR